MLAPPPITVSPLLFTMYRVNVEYPHLLFIKEIAPARRSCAIAVNDGDFGKLPTFFLEILTQNFLDPF